MATTPDVMRKLQTLTKTEKINSGAYIHNYFHAKLYLFKCEEKWTAYVGSGNFTTGGWSENEELFVRITDTQTCEDLVHKFEEYENDCEPISDELISRYEESYKVNSQLDVQKRKQMADLTARLNASFDINLVNFAQQFFSKEDHLAFEPGKTHLDTKEIHEERRQIRNKLYKLNDLLAPRVPNNWELHPHYDDAHIASHIETMHHHNENVHSLWIGYGRSKAQLKQYGKYVHSNNTPLFYMRMQVIVSYDKIGVWLMPGKSGAGEIDRENFQRKLENDSFSEKFFKLLTGLGDDYWIEVADDMRPVNDFENSEELREYLWNDNWRKYYFIIGRNYELGSPELTQSKIVQTCLDNFSKYLPLYDLIRDKSFG